MNDEPQIPLLQDLLYRGHPESGKPEIIQTLDENTDFEIEQDEGDIEITFKQETLLEEEPEEKIPDKIDPSVQELLIDEEIRQILDKHMDKAYEEIIRLLNNRIS